MLINLNLNLRDCQAESSRSLGQPQPKCPMTELAVVHQVVGRPALKTQVDGHSKLILDTSRNVQPVQLNLNPYGLIRLVWTLTPVVWEDLICFICNWAHELMTYEIDGNRWNKHEKIVANTSTLAAQYKQYKQ